MTSPNHKETFSIDESSWNNFCEQKPYGGEYCLTSTKDGLIEGYYDPDEDVFRGHYFGKEREWLPTSWISYDDLTEKTEGLSFDDLG